MDYAQVMPSNITKLNKYFVPTQLFVCTCIALILFLIISLTLLIMQFYRTFKGYSNIDYSVDYIVKYQANKTIQAIPAQQQTDEDKQYLEASRKYSRTQSRFLQLWTLLPIVAINIGTNTCGIMEIVGFGVTAIFYYIFNILRISQNKFLRILWVFPLILCYIPFYVFTKNLPQR